MTLRRVLALGALLAAVVASGTALAQSRRLVLTEEKIEGKIQKPEITIFITRQNLNTSYNLELKESFLPKILESVETKPF